MKNTPTKNDETSTPKKAHFFRRIKYINPSAPGLVFGLFGTYLENQRDYYRTLRYAFANNMTLFEAYKLSH